MASVRDNSTSAFPASTFPVSERDQLRNVLLFGANTALTFFGSPVLNVGRFHAPVCRALGASDTVANLPSSAYLVMAASPLVLACLFPQVSLLKRVLVICYSVVAATCGLVALSLVLPVSNSVKIAAVVLQGIVTGACLTTTTMFLFEAIGRAAEPEKRGRALSLGYGRGPALGLVAALALQLWLSGGLFGFTIEKASEPWNFALPFLAAVPIMGLAAYLSSRFVIAIPEHEPDRGPLLSSTLRQLGDFFRNKWLFVTFVIGVLSFWGFSIGGNMTLYTREVLGVAPETLVGYQLALRFGCKIIAGLFMGALLARIGPKGTMLVTGLSAASGILLAITASGNLFLLSFGLLGAGELFSVYMTNYILSASTPSETRRNMGFASLAMLPAAPAAAMFGAISEHYKNIYSHAVGYRVSFGVALGFMVVVLAMTALLPFDPSPARSSETPELER